MATMAQITAAVANARFSTGPRSPEGKAVSSKNATKLGLYAQTPVLPGEDPQALAAIAHAYRDEYRPETATEQALLDDDVRFHWLKRRYIRIETEVINARLDALPEDSDPDTAVAQVFMQDCDGPKLLEKIFRRQQAAERQYRCAVSDLRLAIAARRSLLAAAPRSAEPATAATAFSQERTGFAADPLLDVLLNPAALTNSLPLARPSSTGTTRPGSSDFTSEPIVRNREASPESR
jgi:hypothetical protein